MGGLAYILLIMDAEEKKKKFLENWAANKENREKFAEGFKSPGPIKGAFDELLSKFGIKKKKEQDPEAR